VTARLDLVVRRHDPDAVATLLCGLPEWFGIEEANAAYVESARTLPTVLALDDGVVVGALLWRRHFPSAAEVHTTNRCCCCWSRPSDGSRSSLGFLERARERREQRLEPGLVRAPPGDRHLE
jgi:hypothetical protein